MGEGACVQLGLTLWSFGSWWGVSTRGLLVWGTSWTLSMWRSIAGEDKANFWMRSQEIEDVKREGGGGRRRGKEEREAAQWNLHKWRGGWPLAWQPNLPTKVKRRRANGWSVEIGPSFWKWKEVQRCGFGFLTPSFFTEFSFFLLPSFNHDQAVANRPVSPTKHNDNVGPVGFLPPFRGLSSKTTLDGLGFLIFCQTVKYKMSY